VSPGSQLLMTVLRIGPYLNCMLGEGWSYEEWLGQDERLGVHSVRSRLLRWREIPVDSGSTRV
jgi:hypothetical protein